MKIGMIRHFRVDLQKKRIMTAKEYENFRYNYDKADVIPNEIIIDEEWDKCYCSSLPRAVTTAKTVYHGDIILTDRLVEIPARTWGNIKVNLPYFVWVTWNRLSWITNRASHPEGRTNTIKRINDVLDEIVAQEDENILIVSHAGTMYEIQKILRRKGFKGTWFFKPRNGKLYVFEKDKP